jgi:hypothetical protein
MLGLMLCAPFCAGLQHGKFLLHSAAPTVDDSSLPPLPFRPPSPKPSRGTRTVFLLPLLVAYFEYMLNVASDAFFAVLFGTAENGHNNEPESLVNGFPR